MSQTFVTLIIGQTGYQGKRGRQRLNRSLDASDQTAGEAGAVRGGTAGSIPSVASASWMD
jgi:hypothetical protein